MRAGVIDVGSNTVRLLVASVAGNGLEPVAGERAYLGLAADIEQGGAISSEKLGMVRAVAERYARIASRHAVERLEVIVTAPGRQAANAVELHATLAAATGVRVRQLSAEEEGRLAYAGALCGTRLSGTVAVVDVGGGSTQIMVGTEEAPAWLSCLDLGSLRLTEQFVQSDPPAPDEVDALERAVDAAVAALTPPLPLTALATGGTARTLRRIVGRRLGEKNLTAAIRRFASCPAAELAAEYDVLPERARVLLGGSVVLRAVHRRLGVKLEVAKGGVREGAVRGLLAELGEAAA